MNTQELQAIADQLVKDFGYEIARDGDWWFGTDTHDFNIHQREDGYYSINVYEYNANGTNYSSWIDLPPVLIQETA